MKIGDKIRVTATAGPQHAGKEGEIVDIQQRPRYPGSPKMVTQYFIELNDSVVLDQIAKERLRDPYDKTLLVLSRFSIELV